MIKPERRFIPLEQFKAAAVSFCNTVLNNNVEYIVDLTALEGDWRPYPRITHLKLREARDTDKILSDVFRNYGHLMTNIDDALLDVRKGRPVRALQSHTSDDPGALTLFPHIRLTHDGLQEAQRGITWVPRVG